MITENKLYYSIEDISKMLGIAKSTSYRLVRELNNELKAKNFIVIAGKVPRAYFDKRYYSN